MRGYRKLRFKPYVMRKTVEGVSFDFLIGDVDGMEWYDLYAEPAWHELRILRDRILRPGDVVLECGAHHGCTTLAIASWVGPHGRVIAFEPNPHNCEILRRNLELNGIENVTVVQAAVGASPGRVEMEYMSVTAGDERRSFTVDVVALDDYLDEQPTVVKLDVQGYEIEALRGARRLLERDVDLAIEVHPIELPRYGSSPDDVLAALDRSRYELLLLTPDAEDARPYAEGTPIGPPYAHLFAVARR